MGTSQDHGRSRISPEATTLAVSISLAGGQDMPGLRACEECAERVPGPASFVQRSQPSTPFILVLRQSITLYVFARIQQHSHHIRMQTRLLATSPFRFVC